MSGSLNKVTLIGNVGADPDIRRTNSGDSIANIRIATSEKWKDKSGDLQEKTEWHTVTVFGALAGVIEKYVQKGSKLYIEGKLQTRKWQDRDGNDRYSTEVIVSGLNATLIMLDGKGGPSREGASKSTQKSNVKDEVLDDNIPF